MQFRMSKKEITQYFEKRGVNETVHQFTVGDRTISYVESGSENRPLVVFVHGSPGSLSAFIDYMADSALITKAHLITVDRPGFGASNFGKAEPSLERQAALIKLIIDKHRGNQPVYLVGHSLGGPVIGRVAIDYPDAVDGLIFIAASIDPSLEPKEWYRKPMHSVFVRWMLPRSIRASNDEIYYLKPQLEAMVPLWTSVTSPSIFLQGEKDKLVHPGNAEFAKTHMPSANVKIVMKENLNHFIPWTAPALVTSEILTMIATNNSAVQPSNRQP